MKKEAGLWIDHRKAVIVIVKGKTDETKEVRSSIENEVRYSDGSHVGSEDVKQQTTAEDKRDRQYMNHLNRYYDDVIAHIHDAATVQIFGPGEAKGELEKRLAKRKFAGSVDVIETVDKLTDKQIEEKVRLRFRGR
ncbi:MAG: hypothetical protein CVV49_16440 [Spirochaetae bacterium HGW-Spirochaetae-5]|nr:MAG: hypothetical protein CVV49_16440 [Spirochaetae bacterium HGW-Spirochaetae-5]